MARAWKGLLVMTLVVATMVIWVLLSGLDRFSVLLILALGVPLLVMTLGRRPAAGETAGEGRGRGGVPGERPAPPPPQARLRDPVQVLRTFRPAEVMLAKMELEGAGIPFATGNEYFGSLYPSADGMASVEILVERQDLDRARVVLEPLLKPGRSDEATAGDD